MKTIDKSTLALRISEALLLYKGEISIGDIRAIPFLENPEHADMIASYLANKFKTQISSRRTEQDGFPDWEQLISLKK